MLERGGVGVGVGCGWGDVMSMRTDVRMCETMKIRIDGDANVCKLTNITVT